ncbi:MAG: hypothetical protein JSW27_02050 [Phycisphaerales bacterium]|nr:MAG: hypothetical protein JSW27_02050 [Phycisphaerales bacterium]
MVAFDGSEPCNRAEAYYHDLLEGGDSPAVPQDVAAHIRRCGHCRQRLKRLRETLLETEREGTGLQSQGDRDLVGELEAQFAFLGEPLTCERVKPFLPSLLAPETQMRIPTPVTVHIDQCPECARDLESLRALDLNSEQLARLGRLYADNSVNGFWVCLRVQSSTTLVRPGGLEHADAEAIDHLCVCPRCRHRLYRQRQRLLEAEQHDAAGQGTLDCADISDADLFDFVVPYGNFDVLAADGRSGQCAERIRSCPHCLAKAQQLHRTVFGVLERPDSGVVTVYRARSEPCRSEAQAESPYRGYPVDVQVTRPEADETVSADTRVRGFSRLKPAFRMALTAAAVIPVAMLFVMSARSALGLTPRRLNEIAAANPCVHISVFGEDLSRPKQEIWASRSRRLLISETDRGRTVVDLARGRTDFIPAHRSDESASYDARSRDTDLARAERSLDRLLGRFMDDLQWDSKLNRREDAGVGETRLEVYELAWAPAPVLGNAARPQKWVVYVDPVSSRPVKTESFGWDRIEGAMVKETRRFAYPDEDEILRQLNEVEVPLP